MRMVMGYSCMDRELRGAATELEAGPAQHAAVGRGDASSSTAHAELPGKCLRGSCSTWVTLARSRSVCPSLGALWEGQLWAHQGRDGKQPSTP